MTSSIEIKVRGYHLDAFGVVNHGRIIEFLEEARWAYFDQRPETVGAIHQAGVAHSVVNFNIDYLKPVQLDKTLRIETIVSGVSMRSIAMKQEIYLTTKNELAVKAQVTNVFFHVKGGQVVDTDDQIFSTWDELQKKKKRR